jgi:hypothetical protein
MSSQGMATVYCYMRLLIPDFTGYQAGADGKII